jgi:hypothetical protein
VVEGTPRIDQQFRLDGLQALPFLTAAAGFQRLRATSTGAEPERDGTGRFP